MVTQKLKPIEINQEDAFLYIIKCIREEEDIKQYGYNVYLPKIMKTYLMSVHDMEYKEVTKHYKFISPVFYSAAWELCRRGILRPGISKLGEQSSHEGSAGNGYSITPFGETWLKEADKEEYVPTEPERFGELMGKYNPRFGSGFAERAQEAIRCYGAHAYLACCAMCGAAAESIMLTCAIKIKQSEESVLKIYRSSGGRGRIEDIVINPLKKRIKNEIKTHNSILKYWRDISSHGKKSDISDVEAYLALVQLLMLAQVVNDNWDSFKKTD